MSKLIQLFIVAAALSSAHAGTNIFQELGRALVGALKPEKGKNPLCGSAWLNSLDNNDPFGPPDSMTSCGKPRFQEACTNHIQCYKTPKKMKAACDGAFLNEMTAVCEKDYKGNQRCADACTNRAKGIHSQAVQVKYLYPKAQKKGPNSDSSFSSIDTVTKQQ